MNGPCMGITRRQFVKGAALLVGGMLARPAGAELGTSAGPAAQGFGPMPKATLGRTGVEVSRLVLGCGAMRAENVTPDMAVSVVHRALELGVNYVDVAPVYGAAEEKIGPAIKEIRDKVFLVTKTEDPTYEGTWNLLRQSLTRMQTDHIDMIHLHNFGDEKTWPDLNLVFSKQGALGALQEARQQGVIRFIGASGHLYPSRFHAALDTDEFDVFMNAVSYIVQHTYAFDKKVWPRARQKNVGLVAMKTLGGRDDNQYQRVPADQFVNAIRWGLSLPGCAGACIGFENIERLEKAAAVVTNHGLLSDEEQVQMAKAGMELAFTEEWRTRHGAPTT